MIELESAEAIPGWICLTEEMVWLQRQATRFELVLEVGTWLGRSAAALALGGPKQVWTVDHFMGSPDERDTNHREALERDLHAEAVQNLASFPNVTVLKMGSVEAAKTFGDGALDMVFLDGAHDTASVLADLRAWRPKVRSLLCGHDRDWQGVIEALGIYGVPFECGPGSLWYVEMII